MSDVDGGGAMKSKNGQKTEKLNMLCRTHYYLSAHKQKLIF